jgi:histidine phosphotransferase ChpT
MIDLGTAEQVSRGFVGRAKHRLGWKGPAGYIAKDQCKLLLNLVACGVAALPRGGEIEVQVAGPLSSPQFTIRCTGLAARPPMFLAEFLAGGKTPPLDAMTIQPYYAAQLAESAQMKVRIIANGDAIVLEASSKH